jgi:hypothetical protein
MLLINELALFYLFEYDAHKCSGAMSKNDALTDSLTTSNVKETTLHTKQPNTIEERGLETSFPLSIRR